MKKNHSYYSYYIKYEFAIKREFYNEDVKKTFIESEDFVPYTEKLLEGREVRGEKPKGPELEPSIRRYQEEVEQFLQDFSYGLFLNKETSSYCPKCRKETLSVENGDSVLEEGVSNPRLAELLKQLMAENMIEEHRLDGIRHERCLKLVGMSLNRLREIYKELGSDFRSPTIREFASAIGVTYQKAANIAPLLGREYGFITEKERREIEKEEAKE